MDWLIQHDACIHCHKREILIGQDSDQPIIFRAQRPRPKETYISTLRGSDKIHGIESVFIVS